MNTMVDGVTGVVMVDGGHAHEFCAILFGDRSEFRRDKESVMAVFPSSGGQGFKKVLHTAHTARPKGPLLA